MKPLMKTKQNKNSPLLRPFFFQNFSFKCSGKCNRIPMTTSLFRPLLIVRMHLTREPTQSSTTGPMAGNGIKTIRTAVFHSMIESNENTFESAAILCTAVCMNDYTKKDGKFGKSIKCITSQRLFALMIGKKQTNLAASQGVQLKSKKVHFLYKH